MYKYVFWGTKVEPNYCGLTALNNVENPIDLQKGLQIKNFPENASFVMDRNFPKAVKLADNVYNLRELIVVSQRLKEFIERTEPPEVEYLPVSIINHKGRVASKDYFIVNPYKLLDCIDLEGSEIEWNSIDPQIISACFEMVIDETRIDPDATIFRLKYYPTKILVRRDLADEILNGNFTGAHFIEIEDLEY